MGSELGLWWWQALKLPLMQVSERLFKLWAPFCLFVRLLARFELGMAELRERTLTTKLTQKTTLSLSFCLHIFVRSLYLSHCLHLFERPNCCCSSKFYFEKISQGLVSATDWRANDIRHQRSRFFIQSKSDSIAT